MDTLSSQIESLLFASAKAVMLNEICKIVKIKPDLAEELIAQLQNEYLDRNRGIRITISGRQIELVTAPENSDVVSKLIKHEKSNITGAQIETLTLLAYRGPLSKPELEELRGVNCSLILKNLKIADLITEISENHLSKYQISTKFLNALGVSSNTELPDFEKLGNYQTQ